LKLNENVFRPLPKKLNKNSNKTLLKTPFNEFYQYMDIIVEIYPREKANAEILFVLGSILFVNVRLHGNWFKGI
jgi:hypothetical protein